MKVLATKVCGSEEEEGCFFWGGGACLLPLLFTYRCCANESRLGLSGIETVCVYRLMGGGGNVMLRIYVDFSKQDCSIAALVCPMLSYFDAKNC